MRTFPGGMALGLVLALLPITNVALFLLALPLLGILLDGLLGAHRAAMPEPTRG